MRLNEIVETLEGAGQALKRLPVGRPERGYRSAWPDVLREVAEAYGYEAVRLVRLPPTREQMTALDRVSEWLWWLDADTRAVVVARSMGCSWRAIMRMRRRQGRGTRMGGLRLIYLTGIAVIHERLSAGAA